MFGSKDRVGIHRAISRFHGNKKPAIIKTLFERGTNGSACSIGNLKSFGMPARPTCDLMCARGAKRLRCCGKRVCNACTTKLLKTRFVEETWHLTCPFCRAEKLVTQREVKELMHAHCPNHAQVVETDVGRAAVVHQPSLDGHYHCSGSSLRVLPLDMPGVFRDMEDEIKILTSALAESEAARAANLALARDLETENRRFRCTANVLA